MLQVLRHGLGETRRLVVEHPVLLTHLLHNGLDVRVVAVVDAGEEMVFDLQVESPREEEGEPSTERAGVAKAVSSEHLVHIVIRISDVNVFVREMVDLRRDHEAY